MDLQLDEKVALAAGASKGIGRRVAGHLAAEGTEAAITARTPGPLEPTSREIRSATGRRVPAPAWGMSLTAEVARRMAAPADRLGRTGIPVTSADRSPGEDGARRKAIMDR